LSYAEHLIFGDKLCISLWRLIEGVRAKTRRQAATFLSKISILWKKYLYFGIKIRKIGLLVPKILQNELFPANSGIYAKTELPEYCTV